MNTDKTPHCEFCNTQINNNNSSLTSIEDLENGTAFVCDKCLERECRK